MCVALGAAFDVLLLLEGCSIAQEVLEDVLDVEGRILSVTASLLVDNDWQQLIDCTPFNGTLQIDIPDVIQPSSQIIITRPITIRSLNPPSAIFTCPPEDQGVFRILYFPVFERGGIDG